MVGLMRSYPPISYQKLRFICYIPYVLLSMIVVLLSRNIRKCGSLIVPSSQNLTFLFEHMRNVGRYMLTFSGGDTRPLRVINGLS